MVEKDHPQLSVAGQCRLLLIPRSTFYHQPAGESAENLGLMALIDRQFMETPFYGVRQMTWHLRNEGHAVNPKRIRRLMRLMSPPLGRFALQIACWAMDADLSASEHEPPRQGAPAISLLAPRLDDRPPEPGLVRRYHLSADAPGLPLPRGDHGLAQPPSAVLAAVEHAGG